jgi:hypothetical protein
MLLRLAGPGDVESVDWDRFLFRVAEVGSRRACRQLDLANPLGFTKAETDHILQGGRSLDAILDDLGAAAPTPCDAPAQFICPYAGTTGWPM